MTPESPPQANSNRRYAVFLSYRHADNKEQGRQWATWLHQVLEGYEVPADLIGTKNSKGDSIPASLYPVFRDEEELPADADLTRHIRQALENSELLVVICSPRAVQSRFVSDEIRYFKELGKADRILALMIDGEPNATDDPDKARLGIMSDSECLPQPLRFGVSGVDGNTDWSQRTEPVAADVRPEGKPEQGWTTGSAYREALHNGAELGESEIDQKVRVYEQRLELAKLKVVAGALGVALGVLTKRDKAMQLEKARQRARTLRRWLGAVVFLAVLALAGGFYAWFQREQAVRQRKEALKTASETDFAIADLKLRSDEIPSALAYLSRSLQNNPENVKASSRVISLASRVPYAVSVMRHNQPVWSAALTPDGKFVVTTSGPFFSLEDRTARIWDAQTGQAIGEPIRNVFSSNFSPDGKWMVTIGQDAAQVWNMETGKTVGEPMRHEGVNGGAVFSADGKRLFTTAKDGTAQVWDAQTGKPLGQPMRHEDCVGAPILSPDWKWILTISKAGEARLWDTQTGIAVGRAFGEQGAYKAFFSLDSQRVVVFSSNSDTARVWDVQTVKPLGQPINHKTYNFREAIFSPDGKWLVTIGQDAARVWNIETGKAQSELMRHEEGLNAAIFSPDGKWIVTASGADYGKYAARVWDAATGKPVGEPMRHEGGVHDARFSSDGKWIVTASFDNTARVWAAQADKVVAVPMRHDEPVTAAHFSPNGKWIVTASQDNTARVWDGRTGAPVTAPMHHEDIVNSASFSADSRRVVTAAGRMLENATIYENRGGTTTRRKTDSSTPSLDPTARIWDTETGKPLAEPMRHEHKVTMATFSSNQKWVVTASADKTARLWDAQDGKAVGQPMRHDEIVNTASFSPDSQWVLTASADKTARLWDARTGGSIREPMRHDEIVNTANFSPDGKWIVTASGRPDSSGCSARIWNAHTCKAVGEPMLHQGAVKSAVFSPDGKHVMTVSYSTIQIWDARTGKSTAQPMLNESHVNAASFSPDGQWIATASGSLLFPAMPAVRIWNAESGHAIDEPIRQKGAIESVSFSPDGKWIVTGSDDGTARIWETGIIAGQAPGWLARLAEVLGGMHLSVNGVAEPVDKTLPQLREELKNLAGSDDLSRFGRWFVADSSARTISPQSSITMPDFVSQRLKENRPESVEEAYRVDPGNPLIVASLAKFEKNKDKALFLCRHSLKRARVEGGEALVEKVRTIVLAAVPDFTE